MKNIIDNIQNRTTCYLFYYDGEKKKTNFTIQKTSNQFMLREYLYLAHKRKNQMRIYILDFQGGKKGLKRENEHEKKIKIFRFF